MKLLVRVSPRIVVLMLALCPLCAAQEKKNFAYGILVDSTGSMRSQFNTVLTIAKTIVNQVHDRGPVSIFDFHSEPGKRSENAQPKARIEASQNEQLLLRAIDSIYIEGGQTTLLDAIAFMSASLNQQSPDADKVIILITDGEDRRSKIKPQQLIEELRKQKVSVFSIGLVQDLEGNQTRATNLLKTLANETGGRAVFPKRPSDPKEVLRELAIPIN